jgi:hypothetical protein
MSYVGHVTAVYKDYQGSRISLPVLVLYRICEGNLAGDAGIDSVWRETQKEDQGAAEGE